MCGGYQAECLVCQTRLARRDGKNRIDYRSRRSIFIRVQGSGCPQTYCFGNGTLDLFLGKMWPEVSRACPSVYPVCVSVRLPVSLSLSLLTFTSEHSAAVNLAEFEELARARHVKPAVRVAGDITRVLEELRGMNGLLCKHLQQSVLYSFIVDSSYLKLKGIH